MANRGHSAPNIRWTTTQKCTWYQPLASTTPCIHIKLMMCACTATSIYKQHTHTYELRVNRASVIYDPFIIYCALLAHKHIEANEIIAQFCNHIVKLRIV